MNTHFNPKIILKNFKDNFTNYQSILTLDVSTSTGTYSFDV